MGRSRNQEYKPKPYKDFESYGYIGADGKHWFTPIMGGNDRKDSVAGITMCMLSHPAFKDLKPRQRLLYLYCKAQYKGMVDRTEFEKNYPQYKGKPEYIYLNHKLMIDVFEMYSKHTAREMYKDIKELTAHGFLVPVCSEKNQRIIYKLVSEWQSWTPHRKYAERPGKPFQYEWVDL